VPLTANDVRMEIDGKTGLLTTPFTVTQGYQNSCMDRSGNRDFTINVLYITMSLSYTVSNM